MQFAAATRKAHDYRHDELCYIQQKQHSLVQICESPVAVTAPRTKQISVYFVPDTRKTQINGGATCALVEIPESCSLPQLRERPPITDTPRTKCTQVFVIGGLTK